MIKQLWKNYNRYISVSKKESIYSLLLGIVGAFSETFSIFLLANLITELDNKNLTSNSNYIDLNFLEKEYIITIFLIFALFSALFYFLSNKNIVNAKCKVERFVRKEITELTLNIKWEYYLRLSQGDISKSIISEGQNISEGYMYFLSSLTYILIAIAYFVICLFLVPDTFFILILYAFLAFRIYVFYSKKAQISGKDLSEITSNIGNWTSSIFNNLKYIRTISKDRLAKEESKNIFLKFSNSYANAMIASYKSKFVTEIITIFFIFIAITYMIINKSQASNLILSLSLFIRMTPKVYNAQTRLLDSVAMISWPRLHYEKITWAKKNMLDTENKKDGKEIEFDGNISLNSISFNYPGSKSILDDLDLEINQNESIGIFGDSGTGKSTLIDLITGIIKPKRGEIFISGVNIQNIDINKWRCKIGIVMQDNYFKNDSLKANIALGEKKIDINKVKQSLIKANAWKFVNRLPNGIDEMIFDRGMRFSGGERQKLALARALYSDPQILLLDEPATGLDQKSEAEFISSIKEILGKMTIIIISHKKEIVQICENIFILENKKLKKYKC